MDDPRKAGMLACRELIRLTAEAHARSNMAPDNAGVWRSNNQLTEAYAVALDDALGLLDALIKSEFGPDAVPAIGWTPSDG